MLFLGNETGQANVCTFTERSRLTEINLTLTPPLELTPDLMIGPDRLELEGPLIR